MKPASRVAIIIASTRRSRFADTVARWFVALAKKRSDFAIDVIDLAETTLSPTLPATHPAMRQYDPQDAAFAARVDAADAFVFITPEYNHGYPASLKSALDLVYTEWQAKPASFVSYGGISGGIRAVEQLRQVLVELHMVPIRDAVVLPMAPRLFGDDGQLFDAPELDRSASLMLDRIGWWAQTLREARLARPYAA